MLTITVLIVACIVITLCYFKVRYAYWKRRGVPGPTPTFFFGNMAEGFLMKKSPPEIFADIVHKYKKFPFVGIFKGTFPAIVVCDPELIKDMTVKSFSNFHDNDIKVDKKTDPIFSRNPFFLNGEEWKTVRSQLTPGFTSGKMKWLYPLLEQSSCKLVKYIEKQVNTKNGFEAKELCIRFTLDNVASSAFGIEGKCFEEDNSEFRQIITNFFTTGTLQSIFFHIELLFPTIMELIPTKIVSNDVSDKFTNMIEQSVKYREENKIVRNDYLNVLMQLRETCKEYEFTNVDVIAHAFGLLSDGYDTTASAMSFMLYHLAANPQVQVILREEIEESFRNNDNKLPYEILQGLPYLNAVISEALRMHPPLSFLGKVCTKPYTYVPREGDGIAKPVVIEKGTFFVLPLSGIHYDPQYFEEPNVFNPDRFLGKNKEKTAKYTYMPFGEGPRTCLGQRFGLLQAKIGIAYIIKNFELSLNKKTKQPIQCEQVWFVIAPKGGIWINHNRL